jgi:hypothetical protein
MSCARAIAATFAAALVACSAAPDDAGVSADQDQTSTATCPTTDPAERAALSQIAAVAGTCADVAAPDVGAARGFRLPGAFTGARHRGRDALFTPGERQWVLGKFTYGTELDLMGEDVDIWLLRGCSGTWEKLGSAVTTSGDHETVEGVDDTGGRVYFEIPEDKRLGVGRHRVRMVVAGDHTFAEQYIEVLPRGAAIAVSDVDGTLTERRTLDLSFVCDEESDFPSLLRPINEQPKLHVGAARALSLLASAGYRPFYLTARPELLQPHTHGFLREKNRDDERGDLPQGIVHTTLGVTGAMNSAAEEFKKNELASLVAKGFVVTFGFGNRQSDVAAYGASRVPFRFYYENPSTLLRRCSQVRDLGALPAPFTRLDQGDFRMGSYEDLHAAFASVPRVCR